MKTTFRYSILLLFFTAFGVAAESLPNVSSDNFSGNHSARSRVCYYNNAAYSIGAILQVGDHLLTCKEATSFETNGQVRWFPYDNAHTDQESNAISTNINQ